MLKQFSKSLEFTSLFLAHYFKMCCIISASNSMSLGSSQIQSSKCSRGCFWWSRLGLDKQPYFSWVGLHISWRWKRHIKLTEVPLPLSGCIWARTMLRPSNLQTLFPWSRSAYSLTGYKQCPEHSFACKWSNSMSKTCCLQIFCNISIKINISANIPTLGLFQLATYK